MASLTFPVKVGTSTVLVEAVPAVGTEPTSRAGDAAEHLLNAFARAQEAIVDVASSTAAMIDATARRAAAPQALEVEFGLKFSAKGNVIMAGASGEATLKVKLTYERTARDEPPAEEDAEEDGL
ncbi:CU044_2847 family protein [Actinomadura rubrisoli]|uniref:Trypsin-co-occurring domain-containing protein n=1 Tax=Actinomadura rubrisoli TaxID=2530368 RepID=A0A4V2YSI3_9ACTN|nr:CU044_2847 family protein [Actinomadura rubrisoli]TDD69767.1 hypothetical protein E1298_37230 [Actinomadura rubrisoli]